MEISQEIVSLLDQLPQPLFLVKDNIIVYANRGALLRNIQISSDVTEIITIGALEYQQFQSGKLILTTTAAGIEYSTIVTNFYEYRMFCLESEYVMPELRAFAVAATALRNPLSDMHICIENLLPEPAIADSPELCTQFKALKKSVYQLHKDVRNMSDAAVLSVPSNMELREIGGLLSEIVEKSSALLEPGAHNIEFKPLPQPLYCQLNTSSIERAILNLIANAIKYGTPGHTVKISMRANIGKVYISVQSDCEMVQEILNSNIFSSYTREPSIKDSKNGIGLGLTVVHSVAAAHKGTLLMEHPENNCIRFTFSLSTDLPDVCKVNSPVIYIDTSGGFDNYLIELSDILPPEAF